MRLLFGERKAKGSEGAVGLEMIGHGFSSEFCHGFTNSKIQEGVVLLGGHQPEIVREAEKGVCHIA